MGQDEEQGEEELRELRVANGEPHFRAEEAKVYAVGEVGNRG